MAAVTLAGTQLADTANQSSYPTGSLTITAGDLPVVVVHAAGTDPAANGGTLTDSMSLGWTKLDERVFGGTGAMYLFRANSRAPSSSSTWTVTFSCPTDAATGVLISVGRFSSAALSEIQWNFKIGVSGVAPNVVMSAAINTNNAVMGVVGTLNNPPGLTAPSGWSASTETGFATPDRGHSFTKKDSGVTLTTVTWGNNAGATWGAYVIEFATSIDGAASGALTTVTVSSNAATGSGAASVAGALTTVTLAAITASATGGSSVDGNATGALTTTTVTPVAAAGSGGAGASGALTTVALAAATGAGSAGASASGAMTTVSLTSSTGAAAGSAGASAALTTVTVTAITGAGSAGASTSGALTTVTVSAGTGSAIGGASASGGLTAVTLGAVTGSASSSGDGNAIGSLPTVTLSAAAAVGSGGSSVSVVLPTVTLATLAGVGSGSSSVAVGLPTITVSSGAGTATGGALALGSLATVTVSRVQASASGGGVAPVLHPLRGLVRISPKLQGRIA